MKTLLIGLDGATWDVLDPLLLKGVLPTISRITTGGAKGVLQSTIPPVTGPAWVSLATGKNPGKTGVIDFFNKRGSTLKPVMSSDFNPSFWDYLPGTVGIVNFPMLFPPYSIDGFMVSGLNLFDSRNSTFPKSLKKAIDIIAPGYKSTFNYHEVDEDVFFKKVYAILKERIAVVLYLLKEMPVDVFIIIFSCTDWVQHVMWKHTDPLHPLYDPDISPQYNEQVITFWKAMDTAIKTIMDKAGDANIFLVSDHGFGPHDQQFNLAKWLQEKGYMSLAHDSLKKRGSRVIQWAITTPAGALIPSRLKKWITRNVPALLPVDSEASAAYCLGHTIPFGGIYINDYTIKDTLIKDLTNIEKDIQKKVSVSIFLPKEMYYGEKIDQLPDILFTINGWRCTITESTVEGPLFKEEPFAKNHTGSHRVNGIFAAYGPDIRPQSVGAISIYDIAPTLLHMHNVPIPTDMDGKVLDLFTTDSGIATKVVYQEREKEVIQKKITQLRSGNLEGPHEHF